MKNIVLLLASLTLIACQSTPSHQTNTKNTSSGAGKKEVVKESKKAASNAKKLSPEQLKSFITAYVDLAEIYLQKNEEKQAAYFAKKSQDLGGPSLAEIKKEFIPVLTVNKTPQQLAMAKVIEDVSKVKPPYQRNSSNTKGEKRKASQYYRRALVRMGPRYPVKATRGGIEGYVVIQLDITASGVPSNLKVIESSPEGVFDKETLAAIKKWRYEPGKLEKEQTIRMDFTLDRKEYSDK